MKSQSISLKSLLIKSLLATTLLASCFALPGTATPAHAQQTVDYTSSGNDPDGGVYYSFYRNGLSYADGTTLYMTLSGGGTYSVNWSGLYGDFTCGKGWYPGTYDRTIGYICSNYYTDNGGSFGACGWTYSNPSTYTLPVEYYVNEIYGGNPPTGTDYISRTTVDGIDYDNYHTSTSGPNIEGDGPFEQYVSNRVNQASTGDYHSINMASHFDIWKAWADSRYPVPSAVRPESNHCYQIMLTEGYSGGGAASGSVTATVY